MGRDFYELNSKGRAKSDDDRLSGWQVIGRMNSPSREAIRLVHRRQRAWHTIVGVLGEVPISFLDRATRKIVILPALFQVPLGIWLITVRTKPEP